MGGDEGDAVTTINQKDKSNQEVTSNHCKETGPESHISEPTRDESRKTSTKFFSEV